MNNLWRIFGIVAAFILVFLFGAAVGGSGTVFYFRGRFQAAQSQRQKEQAERRLERQKEREQAQQLSQQLAALRQQLQDQQGRGGMMARRGPLAPEQFGPHLMQVFANRLELTPDQQQQVHTLVFQAGEELRRLSRESGRNTQIAIEHLEDQISSLLTPPQRERFNAMIQRSREAFQHWSEQQQQWRAQQRLEQEKWRQARPGSGPGSKQGDGPVAPAPAHAASASPPASAAPAPPAPAARP
ncbi:MAG TPA: hypothetical protein VHC86_08775 [Opitutaceae bacterium]|nr:hypothetical protein [Opitutaceae bacterium]